jgi:hypothetical protein
MIAKISKVVLQSASATVGGNLALARQLCLRLRFLGYLVDRGTRVFWLSNFI